MPDANVYSKDMINQAAVHADRMYPRLTQYAPTVGVTSMQDRPDVAGFYEPETKSVQINSARTKPLDQNQLAGLIMLERARGHLSSPEGEAWVQRFPLTNEQRNWWDKFYLQTAGDAPKEPAERDKVIKSTILSRLIVGDALPEGAPPLKASQHRHGRRLSQHYKVKP